MRHRKKKKIGKGTDSRRKLLRTLGSSLILYERIETSLAKGRAARQYTEKLITLAKQNSLHARRLLVARLSPMAAKKAVEVIGPKYKERKGGYTRLTKLSNPNSASSKVILELVE
jgi:large subunit ribosomal protein L17